MEDIQENVDKIDQSVREVSSLKDRAEDAAERAENATKDLDEAIAASEKATEDAEEATVDARNAADTAIEATSALSTLQSALIVLRNNLSNTYIPTIESAITRSNTAITNATDLVTRGNTILADAQNSVETMDLYESEWLERRFNIDSGLVNMQDAIQRASSVEESIENMTVTSESISSGVPSAEISDVDNHKNIHFKLQKGDPGKPYIVKGRAYSTIEELTESVQDPSEGDLYNVGNAPPYNVYRWTGNEWEDQGEIGFSVLSMTHEDVDDIFNGEPIEDQANKYMGADGAVYYTNAKILPLINAKVNSVAGKGLSTNDFTDIYKDQIDINKTSISVLSSNKVDKISGKGLSSNDFTNTYKIQIDSNKANIDKLSLNSLTKDFASYVALPSGILNEILFAVNYNSGTYKLNGAQLISDIISLGSVLTNGSIATIEETRTYLGIGV